MTFVKTSASCLIGSSTGTFPFAPSSSLIAPPAPLVAPPSPPRLTLSIGSSFDDPAPPRFLSSDPPPPRLPAVAFARARAWVMSISSRSSREGRSRREGMGCRPPSPCW